MVDRAEPLALPMEHGLRRPSGRGQGMLGQLVEDENERCEQIMARALGR